LGCRVIAVDEDQNAKLSFERAVSKVPCGKGEASFTLSDARAVEIDSETVDCVYCISVLEHIADFERVISEASRILRPNGTFILTFDIDLRGNFDLGPEEYVRLMDSLKDNFSPKYPERTVHPLRILTSDSSIYPMYPRKSIFSAIVSSMRAIKSRLSNSGATQARLLVSTYGVCLSKRSLRV
jgi:SAM-dependent methyltransferase